MSAPANGKLVGRWPIVEADIWDRDYLDLCRPATMTIAEDGRGPKSPLARAKPDSTSNTVALRSDSPGKVSTKWTTSPAPALPNCSTTAPLKSNSPITNGDEAVPKAKREISSTACRLDSGGMWSGPSPGKESRPADMMSSRSRFTFRRHLRKSRRRREPFCHPLRINDGIQS
jgi:hypothetical protein